MGKSRGVCRILVEKPERRRPLGRSCRRWEDNIEVDLQDVGWTDKDWIGVVQNWNRRLALVNAVMKLGVP
jgi:hypothetical protein